MPPMSDACLGRRGRKRWEKTGMIRKRTERRKRRSPALRDTFKIKGTQNEFRWSLTSNSYLPTMSEMKKMLQLVWLPYAERAKMLLTSQEP